VLALVTLCMGCGAPGLPPRTALPGCSRAGVSGLAVWDVETSKDGSTLRPGGSSALAFRDGEYVAQVVFALASASSYGTMNVPLRSQREDPTHRPADLSVNLGDARMVTVTYASTADLFLQIRHGARAHGGHHYRARLGKTAGAVRTETLRFADFAQPPWVTSADRYPLDLRNVFSFTFAALESAEVTVAAFEIDGFVPSCE